MSVFGKIKPPPRPRRTGLARLRIGSVLPLAALTVLSVTVSVRVTDTPGGRDSAPRATQPSRVSFADGSPVGELEATSAVRGGLRLKGWAYDPNAASTSLTVVGTVDGVATTTATASMADVAGTNPDAGTNHGFSFVVAVPEGSHKICVLAKNVGVGTDFTIGCVTKSFDYGPVGEIDAVDTKTPGHVHVKGWAIDLDSPATSLTVKVVVDGTRTYTATANRSRPDKASTATGAGNLHGFELSPAVGQGKHTVCVTAVNVGLGTDNSLGCRTVTLDDRPVGALEVVRKESGKLRIIGWALDRDKPTTAVAVRLQIDSGAVHTVTAGITRTDVAAKYPNTGSKHGFSTLLPIAEGTHTVCATAVDIGYGSNRSLGCRNLSITFTPTAVLSTLTATSTGVRVTGWATDPDTSAAVSVRLLIDGATRATVTANGTGSTHSGHNFTGTLVSRSGTHTVCAVAVNLLYGTRNSPSACRSITLALSPLGRFESLTRAGTNLRVTGWALDPDTTKPLSVAVTVDGRAAGTYPAATPRDWVAKNYPQVGADHGISALVPADDGEHTVCVVAKNVSGGRDTSLGCKLIFAVHPVVPSAVRSITATPGYSQATISWSAPTSDGGAPWTGYVITAIPGGPSVSVPANSTSVVMTGLKGGAKYSFSVVARNVAGTSTPASSAVVTIQSGPAPQTTPAPISTSRYIRNIRGASAAEQALMRAEGVADARANPSGHRYLVLLDIGGQNQTYGGVVLSATTRFVTYKDLVTDVQAYIDGYASAQRATAPVMITIGTNNDMDVTQAAGAAWANLVVDPLVSYARKYANITISGANDIEPGFSGSYGATRNWLTGYLANTSAKFVFNGSADGCAWTVTNRSCNNGWSMAGLYNLAAGMAPTRSINLPQIYNYTMADQWKYISLTGVGQGNPRINFGGPLTEYTACAQAGSCGSIGGVSAWTRLWNNLQSHPSLRVSSLPYATDLRIDSK